VKFSEYQSKSAVTDIRPDKTDIAYPLLGLAGEVGSLVAEYKKRLRTGRGYYGFEDEVKEELGDLLWYVAALARTMNIDLDSVAEANIRKISTAWGVELPPPRVYDAGYPPEQRFPRQFEVLFTTYERDGLPRVSIYLGDQAIGDPLDDNVYDEDHYRFHDAFHLAHVAVLGWSPVIRSLMKRKRKANPEVDRVEDGARAVFTEEGLVAFVFSIAANEGYFQESERVDWDLLKTIQRITKNLEVADQPLLAWQTAILKGYSVWRGLCEHNGGIVTLDLDKRDIRFKPRPA